MTFLEQTSEGSMISLQVQKELSKNGLNNIYIQEPIFLSSEKSAKSAISPSPTEVTLK
jgi:hypothetical protein